MLRKILSFVFGLLSMGKKKPISAGKVVVSTRLVKEGGKTYRILTYNDGTTKKEPYDAADPTGIGGFLDGLGR